MDDELSYSYSGYMQSDTHMWHTHDMKHYLCKQKTENSINAQQEGTG